MRAKCSLKICFPILNKTTKVTIPQMALGKRALNSLTPKTENFGGVKVLFPKDGEKGGTWIGVSNKKRTLCLLNGAFEILIKSIKAER